MHVKSKEIIGLAGPNGAGKTTTFYIIAGVLRADQGSIILNNKDISRLPLYARVKLGIGYLPQEPSILLGISVLDNLMIALQNRYDLNQYKKNQLAQQLMEEFKISHIQNNLGYVLSGGEKRRLEIARTLAIKPKFILLDEPFSGVDPIAILNIKKTIQKLSQKNLGIIITDHNVREIFSICHRIYIIHQGKLIASGSPKSIKKNDYVKNIYLGNFS